MTKINDEVIRIDMSTYKTLEVMRDILTSRFNQTAMHHSKTNENALNALANASQSLLEIIKEQEKRGLRNP